MGNPYGRPGESVRRFSFIKWSVAGFLLAVLLLTWFAAPDPPADTPALAADTGTSAANAPSSGTARAPGRARAGAPTTLAIALAGDGSLKVSGTVADEATRNQWLNEIRLGAQGARVTDELRVGPVSPAAAGWASQSSGLVAVMRERGLAGLRVDGDRVLLTGAAESLTEKREAEKLVQAQLPPGYRMESQVGVGPTAADTTAQAPGTAQATAGAAPAPATGSAREPATQDAPAAGAPRGDKDKLAQDSAARSAGAPERKPARPPANCPRHLRALAQPVYFETDGASIDVEDRKRLLRLGACLKRSRLRLIGYADPRHTDEYNQQLSERRARAVADALIEGGAATSRISVIGAGKARSSAEGASRRELQRSRRVDILLR